MQEPAARRRQFAEDPQPLAARVARDEIVAMHRVRAHAEIPPAALDALGPGDQCQCVGIKRLVVLHRQGLGRGQQQHRARSGRQRRGLHTVAVDRHRYCAPGPLGAVIVDDLQLEYPLGAEARVQRLRQLQPVAAAGRILRRRQQAGIAGGERMQFIDRQRQRDRRCRQRHARQPLAEQRGQPLRIAFRCGQRQRHHRRWHRSVAAPAVRGGKHQRRRAGIAPAQEAFERGEQPPRREHQLRGFGEIGRQFQPGIKTCRRFIQRLRIAAHAAHAIQIVEPRGPEAPREGVARQCQQVADRRQAERAQRLVRGLVPLERGDRQTAQLILPRQRGRARGRRRVEPNASQDACGARRGGIRECGAVAECIEPVGNRAMQPRAAAEQPQAAADFEQQSVGLQHHVRRELVGPAGEFGERRLLALRVAFERDQLARQRLRRGELHAGRHAGRLRRGVAVDHHQPLRWPFDDRQRPDAGQTRARPAATAARATATPATASVLNGCMTR